MKPLFTLVLLVTLLPAAPFAFGSPPGQIGTVRSTDGEVLIVRNSQVIRAAPNLMVYEGDIVETGANGKAGLVMEDDTFIAMGRKSKLILSKFQFRPKEKNLSCVIRLLQGTASLISGGIARLAPGAVRIETPQAAIGVRGSHVLVKVD